MNSVNYQPLSFKFLTEEKMLENSKFILNEMQKRRSIRKFSSRTIRRAIIENCIKIASSAPSGANKQPWKFVVVSDSEIKKKIRLAAEKEEHKFYTQKAPEEWLNAIAHLGTNEQKPFLEEAPYLITVFEEKYSIKDISIEKNYYTSESVGIAAGFLIAALHLCGLAVLTYTPSRKNFLNEILNRPKNEKPFLILVVGYPPENAEVPEISKKKLEEVAVFL